MDAVVEPMVSSGGFDGITISRARLVSQIIDNLNKAAAVGFAPDEIAPRLKAAWTGESARLRVYDQVQEAALAFRRACLEGNLLDWSLQMEVFARHLLPLPQVRRYLLGGYRHLIVDNVEEDIPAAHDLLRAWLPRCESALVVCDEDGGYRVFLGADPGGALALAELCQAKVELTASHVMAPEVEALGTELAARIPAQAGTGSKAGRSRARQALTIPEQSIGFHPQMLDWVADQISRLVMEEGLPPGEIAVLAPFLSDALRFSLSERLARYGIAVRTHRPSRELGEEPAARCLLTLARLAHPQWHSPASGRRPPPRADVAQALGQAIADLDPVRAQLLAEVAYRVEEGVPSLAPFHQMVPEMRERLTYLLGNRYDELRRWLQAGRPEGTPPEAGPAAADAGGDGGLDFFLSRLFGEVLSQAGFGFHGDFDRGAVAASLIESAQKFRQGYAQPAGSEPDPDLGLVYVDMVERGVVAAQSISSWTIRPEDAVLLVPAYTFLMMNQPVMVQFWLDAGSRAWFERIYQPLTHPFVLRRDWDPEGVWTDDDEVRVREEALRRLVRGLCRRCRRQVYLAYSELNERGYEQRGPLLQAVHQLRRQSDRD